MGFLDALKDMFTLDSFYAPEPTPGRGMNEINAVDGATQPVGIVDMFATNPAGESPDLSQQSLLQIAEQQKDALIVAGAPQGLGEVAKNMTLEGGPFGRQRSDLYVVDQQTEKSKAIQTPQTPHDVVEERDSTVPRHPILGNPMKGLPHLGNSPLPDLNGVPVVPEIKGRPKGRVSAGQARAFVTVAKHYFGTRHP